MRLAKLITSGEACELQAGTTPGRLLARPDDFVRQARTELDFARAAHEAAEALGFRWGTYRMLTEGREFAVSTYPFVWHAHYRARSYLHIDPVLLRVSEHRAPCGWLDTSPFAWDDANASLPTLTHKQTELLDEAAAVGVRSGITFPLATETQALVLFTLATDERSSQLLQHARYFARDLQAFMLNFHERFCGEVLCARKLVDTYVTPRQLYCLALAADGHSAKQIARTAGLAPRTVEYHLNEIKKRLGATNLPHAVTLALRKGLL